MKTTAPKLQPPALDAELRDVARLLRACDWREHLAAIALELGAIDAADYEVVRIAGHLGVLDNLESDYGQRAWAALAPWLPDEVLN